MEETVLYTFRLAGFACEADKFFFKGGELGILKRKTYYLIGCRDIVLMMGCPWAGMV